MLLSIIRECYFYLGDLLYEIKESIEAFFMNYINKKRELKGYIAGILNGIFFFKSEFENNRYRESDIDYQQCILAGIQKDVRSIRSLLAEGSKEEYGGMLYKYFIDKFDIDKFSDGKSPITKEQILDKDLFEEYLNMYKKW